MVLVMRIAALPMYDLPEVADATDALWSALAQRFRTAGVEGVPERLDRSLAPRQAWAEPGLLFAQTCGYPLMHGFAGRLIPIATPCYAVQGCSGPHYSSRIVARAGDERRRLADFAGAVAAINSEDSHSGFNMLRWRVAQEPRRPFFARVLITGGHAASLDAIREGKADIAAVDCVTFALLSRYRPAAVSGIRVLEETASAPGLPFVTAAGTDARTLEHLRRGVEEVFADPALATVRERLMICGVEAVPLSRYEAILDYARHGAGVTLA
jgi:ABC-type phosphate/phosphonate transport system substrate-binding protein